MVYMTKFVGTNNESLLNAFPQRRSGIPNDIRLDTTILIEHLLDREAHFPLLSIPPAIKSKLHLKNCLGEYAG